MKYCVIGAGISGLAAARNLQEHGISCEVLERERDLGGLWNYHNPNNGIYRSAHLISSKPLTEFRDFPMPADYPDYPSHSQALAYVRSYAEHFDLLPLISFETEVKHLELTGSGWRVQLGSGEAREYDGVVIANGHLSEPSYPNYPGEFAGEEMHSRFYKTPDLLRGKRVLVVGAGNSGCDIAVESALNADVTFLSVRRGYHYIPKYIFGKPADQLGEFSLRLRIPLRVRRAVNEFLLREVFGQPDEFGLPKPDHKLLESHPVVNSQIYYHLGHGDIQPKPEVQELADKEVRFTDGSVEEIDVIIYATGYKTTFPFLDETVLTWQGHRPELFLNLFHPVHDNLFFAGLIQPDSGQWWLVDEQMQLVAKFITACSHSPEKAAAFRRLKAQPDSYRNGKIKYLPLRRHALEVEHFSYSRHLRKLMKGLV